MRLYFLATTDLLSKADPSRADQHNPVGHVDVPVPQQLEVTFLPIECIQDATLEEKNQKKIRLVQNLQVK